MLLGENFIAIIIGLFASLLGGVIGYWMYKIVEESKLRTLRAKLPLLGIGSVFMLLIAFLLIDGLHHEGFIWGSWAGGFYHPYYWAVIIIYSLVTAAQYIKFNTLPELLLLILAEAALLRFFFHLGYPSYAFFAMTFSLLVYYIIKNVKYLSVDILVKWQIIGALTIASVVVTFLLEWIRSHGNLATYISFWYILAILEQYFWNLEFKRRKKCGACRGAGFKTGKKKPSPWWAIGFKQFNIRKRCTTCKGVGWVHTYENILHD